ncbi:MAG: class I SAM-dependent methyltransferase [Leeuwenhoekiella sp.]
MIFPPYFIKIQRDSEKLGFDMPSDPVFGNFLKMLVASKPNANILELGTGTGLSLSWMVDGMDTSSHVLSLDNEEKFLKIARKYFKNDHRVSILCADGAAWIDTYEGPLFDLIFADTWPGKFNLLPETLKLVKAGGFYLIDDLKPQENWPEGHNQKVEYLMNYLQSREDFISTYLDWSTGILILCKKTGVIFE